MFRLKSAFAAILVLTVAGCAQTKTPFASSMNRDAMPMVQTEQERTLAHQAQALDRMSKDLVRKTTFKGAALGAVAGCGLAIAGGSKAQCAQAALVGGVIGGVAGNATGKAQAKKRVEIVELNRVLPSLRKTNDQMDVVSGGVAELVAKQDAEIAQMKQQMAQGNLSQQAYDARLAEIRQVRGDVAQALTLSASQARQAKSALMDAQAQGQTGIDWYIAETNKLEAEAVSARAQLSLL
ncbi:hypothetical protein [uncultured Pelagimonas sp.]|uniref:hypothetical protein n=1 Tax=uncultured Pelagimonas sp. TaxID=1618102 RepID=UPI0026285D5A|nr:hypothetical protein [uncultured Pelagimonas sp.]